MASRPQGDPAGGRERLSAERARFYGRIYAAARAGCVDELRRAGCGEEEAEDVFAEALERVMRRLDPPTEGFTAAQTVALLKKACRQRLIDERRRRRVLRIVPLEEAAPRAGRAAGGPAEAAEVREALEIGREALCSLPERDRAIFLQRHQLGLDPEEILRRNPGLSKRTYRKVMQRANARALAAFEQIAGGERCEQMRGERLRRYVAGELAGEELRLLGAHLRRCRSCGLEVARMRTHLHELAAGLALLAGAGGRGAPPVELAARLPEAAGGWVDAAVAVTRAARERLRELAIRAAGSLPGGGESAAGQIAGIGGAKTVSACAGALAAGGLAAGAVPGVGGVELRGDAGRRAPAPATERPAREPGPARVEAPAPSGGAPRRSGARASGGDEAARGKTEPPPQDVGERSGAPTVSGRQTGAEVGAEADGAGIPLPPAPAVTPEADSSSGGGAQRSGSGGGGGSSGGGSSGGEFGL